MRVEFIVSKWTKLRRRKEILWLKTQTRPQLPSFHCLNQLCRFLPHFIAYSTSGKDLNSFIYKYFLLLKSFILITVKSWTLIKCKPSTKIKLLIKVKFKWTRSLGFYISLSIRKVCRELFATSVYLQLNFSMSLTVLIFRRRITTLLSEGQIGL